MQKNIFRAIVLGVALLSLALALPALAAWADVPSNVTIFNCPASVPGCNTPLNVSTYAQTKNGNLLILGSFGAGMTTITKPYTATNFGVYKADMNLLLTTNNNRLADKGGSLGFSNADGFVLGAIKGGATNGLAGQYGGYLGFYTTSADSSRNLNGNNNLTYEKMRISQEGNVGINTTVPQAKLDVAGTVRLNIGNANINKVLVSTDGTGFTAWKTLAEIGGGTSAVNLTADLTRPGIIVTPSPITGAGTIGVNPAVIQKRVTGACTGINAIQAINENGTVTCVGGGTGLPAGIMGNTLYYGLNGWTASSNIYNANGFVGIGTAIPTTKLDINGTVTATGFRLPTGAAAGRVLTSDTTGVATWQTPAAGTTISGLAGRLAMFNPAGTGLTNSPLINWYDNRLRTDGELAVQGFMYVGRTAGLPTNNVGEVDGDNLVINGGGGQWAIDVTGGDLRFYNPYLGGVTALEIKPNNQLQIKYGSSAQNDFLMADDNQGSASWKTCQICTSAYDYESRNNGNGGWSADVCKAFNGGYAESPSFGGSSSIEKVRTKVVCN